jgi:methylglutaconyl-CoA hydratase
MKAILIETNGPITTIWLNRPELRNAFNEDVISELNQSFEQLNSDPETRVIILAGKGKVFSAGADLNWMKSALDANKDTNYQDSRKLADLLDKINRSPKICIARVQGAALGGGMGLVSVCDIVLAEEKAQFGFTEVRLGLIPAIISSFVAPKIGFSWARRYFVSGERFDAQRANQLGLVHEVLPENELDGRLEGLAKSCLAAAPGAVSESKKLLESIRPQAGGDVLKDTSEWIARVRVSEEGQEGTAAFLEKRKPNWIPK